MKQATLAASLLLGLTFLTVTPSHAIIRTERSMNFLSIDAGYTQAWGEYNGIPTFEFIDNSRHYEVDADDLYEPGFSLGLHYGRLSGGRIAYTVGFRWTKANLEDTVDLDASTFADLEPFKLNLYEGEANVNFYLTDFNASTIGPFLGLGGTAGVAALKHEDFESDNDFVSSLHFNFGADFKILQNMTDGSFLTLSSINSWTLVASNDRPRNISIGGGLRWFFRL